MSQENTEDPNSFVAVIHVLLAIMAVVWTFSVSVDMVKDEAKLHHLGELAPAIVAFFYLNWRYDLVGTPKKR